jgi:hypothetical protein
MNDLCGAIPSDRLEETVEVWWPRLQEKIHMIELAVTSTGSAAPERSATDMLAELLELTRGLQRELYVGSGGRETSSLTNPAMLYEQAVLQAISRIAHQQGLHLTHPETTDAPADLKLEIGGRTLYVEVAQNRRISTKARQTLERMNSAGISDPLLVVVNSPYPSSFERYLESGVRIVQWRGPEDDHKLSAALEEISKLA